MEERNMMSERMNERSSHSRRRTSATGDMNKGFSLFKNRFAMVGIVVVLTALVLGLSGCGDENTDETVDSGEIAETSTEMETVVDPSTYQLQKDVVPQVNEVVNAYFTAMKNADADAYMAVVAGEEMTADKLAKKGEFIEDYLDISCYTKPGLAEGEYVAFVYYNVKFRNIDTPAPSLIRLYVCPNADGSMYIYAGAMDSELASYINVISNDDVHALVTQTNQSLKDACASDDKLAALYQLLVDGGVQPTEEETTAEPETGSDEMAFELRDEKVITTTALRVRSTPTTETDDNILGKVEAGEELKRVGYNDSWSKIIYNGKEAYVSSDYVIDK